MDINRFKKTTKAGAVILVVLVALAGVIAAEICGWITSDTASLIVSAILALGTFGYVVLTYFMADAMRNEMDLTRQALRRQRRPEIKQVIEDQIIPLRTDIHNLRNTFRGIGSMGPDQKQVGNAVYNRLPEISTRYNNGATPPRFVNTPVEVDAGEIFSLYHTVNEYQKTFDDAIHELSMLIVEELDNPPSDSDELKAWAKSALQLEHVDIGRSLWDSVEADVIPLRQDIDELTGELTEYRRDILEISQELSRQLDSSQADLMQEYGISEAELQP